MIQYITVNGNQGSQSARGVRAFRLLVPSINGATFAVDSGGQQNIVAGHLYEFQPRAGESPPGVTSADVETNRLLREMLALQSGMTIEAINAALGGPTKGPNGNPKQYPTITFANGTNSMPLVVAYDQEDGNEYVPGALGFSDTVPVAQEGDLASYGTTAPALNGTVAGILGVPMLAKDNVAGRLFIPQGTIGQLAVQATILGSTGGQQFDATAAGGAALTTGTLGSTVGQSIGHVLVRIAGLTTPSTRVLQLNAVRNDASTVLIAATTFGAAVTDMDANFGTAEATPAAPDVGVSSFTGFTFGGMIPTSFNITLTSGAAGDNPRMTVWIRSVA